MATYITLKIGESKGGKPKLLHALRATSDYYGWTEEFPVWIGKAVDRVGSRIVLHDPGRRGHPQCMGGIRLRISRSPDKSRYARGLTNAFKVSRGTGLLDLAELAHFTKVDWYWMESLCGQRIDKARWEQRFLRTTH